MPVRVLQVIGKMDRAGAETMIMNLYNNIDRNKVQFDFLVHSTEQGAFDDAIRQLGGRIYHIKRFKGFNALSYYINCLNFFDKHKEFKIVHGHIGSCASLYLFAAKRAGCFTIAHSHNADNKIRNAHDLFYRCFSYPTRYIADALFGCSTEAGIQRYGKKAVLSKKYKNISNGIELEKFTLCQKKRDIIRSEFEINEQDLVIGTVGRFTDQKNPFFILSIFESIVSSQKNTKCIWVGKGELFDKIKNIIRKKGLQNKIILTGARDDVPSILQAMDCFVFPSLWEGLPVTIIEAQASGLGVVLSDVISHEVEITDLLTWRSLKSTAKEWSEECIKVAKKTRNHRNNPFDSVKSHGYDVFITSKWLQRFYINKYMEISKK